MPRTRHESAAQARRSARESSLTPIYAVAGLTDALAEEARTRVNERIGEAQQRARRNADDLSRFVADLPAQLKALPQTTRERAAQFSDRASNYRTEANSRYEALAGRGKRRLDDAVSQAQAFTGRVQQRSEDGVKEGLKDADPFFRTVQEAATQLRKKATGRTATDTVTPKTARTTPSEKAPTHPSASKSAATKAAAKKTTTKSAAAKTPATKTTAAKTATKTPAKKTTAKKATAKKASGA